MTRFLALAALLALLAPENARAQRVPPFTIAAEAACQKAIGRAARGLVHDVMTGWRRCYQAEGVGRGDCTPPDTSTSEAKFRRRVESGACRNVATFDELGLGPSPAQGSDVLIPALIGEANTLADLLYAPYAGGEQRLQRTDPALYRCVIGVAQAAGKLADKRIDENTIRCIDRDDVLQVSHPERLPACDQAKRAIAVDGEVVKARSRIEARCNGLVAAAALVQATAAAADYAVCRSYPQAENRTICRPSPIYLKTVGGRIDMGWKGSAHDSTIVETLPLPIELENCVGTTQTTCDLHLALAGQVKSVTPSSSNGTAVCLVRKHTGDLTGTLTFTGTPSHVDYAKLNTPSMFDLHLPATLQTPCPTCSGAALGAAGTCQGGASDGLPCVVDGDYGPLGRTSASCRPVSGTRISGLYPVMDGTSTEEHLLAAALPCGFFGLCHCPGQAYPNQCWDTEDLTCNPDGMCAFSPTPCFPDPIVRTGSTGPLVTAGIGCIPQSSSAAVDAIMGLPGPMAIVLEWKFVGGP